MNETFDLDYDGTPAGSGIIRETAEGFAFLWTRPDAQVICRSGFGTVEEFCQAFDDAMESHYRRMQ